MVFCMSHSIIFILLIANNGTATTPTTEKNDGHNDDKIYIK